MENTNGYKEDLVNLKRLVTELNQTNSVTDKKKTLAKHPECKKILKYTYNPFKQYFVSTDNLKKNADMDNPTEKYTDFYKLLEDLSTRKLSGNEAIATVNAFIKDHPAQADMILRVLDRNLKTRTDAKLINKVFPGLVPSFDVALANKYEDHADKIDFKKNTWFASRKLDGVRVITIVDNEGIHFYSRKGKEFTTLEVVKEVLENNIPEVYRKDGMVIDGEMCIVDENGDEDFTSMIKLIRRKNYTVENPKYKIFDMMPLSVFEGTADHRLNLHFSQRLKKIEEFRKERIFEGDILDPVEQVEIKNKEHLTDMTKDAIDAGWEGLIIRKDVPYEGKRTNNMLKVKKFHDHEYVVKDVTMGPIRFIENGREKEEEMLSAITIEHKGYNVSVGSGFSMDFRRQVYENPNLLLGKTVTVTYFEETTNKQGTISLRFPTVKAIYNGKRDM
jgi:DNA ligase-1